MSDTAPKSEWVGPAVLNPKLKLLLTNYASVINPADRFDPPLSAYKKHATFLDACGHDTSELAAAIGGVEAAVVALQEVALQPATPRLSAVWAGSRATAGCWRAARGRSPLDDAASPLKKAELMRMPDPPLQTAQS